MANNLSWGTTELTLPRAIVINAQATLLVKTGTVNVYAVIGAEDFELTELATSGGGATKIDLTSLPDLKFTPTAAQFLVLY